MSKKSDATPRIDGGQEKDVPPDTESLGMVVSALAYLKEEAKNSHVEEVEMIISSSFRSCMAIYYKILKRENVRKYKQ